MQNFTLKRNMLYIISLHDQNKIIPYIPVEMFYPTFLS